MIRYVAGDLLKADCEALVNPVNCVGVMGKGLALQFKKKYPQMYEDYKKHCTNEKLEPGEVYIWEVFNPGYPNFIFNIATKKHWNSESEYEWIYKGLKNLRKIICDMGINSIALPALGCGEGELNWYKVQWIMMHWLRDLKKCDILVYLPKELYGASA